MATNVKSTPNGARPGEASKLLTASVAVALLALSGCSKLSGGPDQMSWAREALQRNPQLEVVATDAQNSSFTVRSKETGELQVVRADQLVAALPGDTKAAAAGTAQAPATASTAGPSQPATPPGEPAAASDQPAPDRTVAPGEAAAPADAGEAAGGGTNPPERVADVHPSGSAAQPAPAAAAGPGHVIASGPGYSLAASSRSQRRPTVAAASPAASAARAGAVEQRHEPIVCQGQRFLQIDNRNLSFDGDAVSAEDGCEVHITNSHITAKGVGVLARKAEVHIENSQIEGDSGSVDASEGAQVYAAFSTFKGLRRRLDDAAFHDMGGNVWN
ncbi:MAG TPA: hypothetical protein VGM84_03180 [Steroidobacteraceae bacterium]|jgi:hypothetical protein